MSNYREILIKTYPLIIDNFIIAGSGFVTVYFIASIGNNNVAASAYIYSIQGAILFPLYGFAYALQPILSECYVKQDIAQIQTTCITAASALFALGIPFLVSLQFMDVLLIAAKQPPHLAHLVGDYFQFAACAYPIMMVNQVIMQFFLSTNQQTLLIPMSLIRSSLDIGLSAVFLFRAKMGIAGCGLANLIEPYLVALGACWYLYASQTHLVKLTDILEKYREFLYFILPLGLPVALQILSETGMRFLNTLVLGYRSPVELEAYQISAQCTYWVILIADSLANSTSVLVGQATKERAFTTIRGALILSGSVAALFLILFATMQRPLGGLFIHKDNPNAAELLQSVQQTMPILGLNALLFSVKYVTMGALRGLKKTFWPMVFDVLASWLIGFSMGLILSYHYNYGALGMAIGDCVGSFTALCLLSMYLSFHFKPQLSESAQIVNPIIKRSRTHHYNLLAPSSQVSLLSRMGLFGASASNEPISTDIECCDIEQKGELSCA